MTTITLTQHELTTAQLMGTMRRSCADGNVFDAQVGKQNPYQIDIDGCIGEMVVAKHMNLFPDLTIGIRKGGADLISKSGKTIDVKSTRYLTGRLLATPKKAADPCDVYILVVVNDTGGRICGYATHEDLFLEKNLLDLGHGKGYALNQDQLTEI